MSILGKVTSFLRDFGNSGKVSLQVISMVESVAVAIGTVLGDVCPSTYKDPDTPLMQFKRTVIKEQLNVDLEGDEEASVSMKVISLFHEINVLVSAAIDARLARQRLLLNTNPSSIPHEMDFSIVYDRYYCNVKRQGGVCSSPYKPGCDCKKGQAINEEGRMLDDVLTAGPLAESTRLRNEPIEGSREVLVAEKLPLKQGHKLPKQEPVTSVKREPSILPKKPKLLSLKGLKGKAKSAAEEKNRKAMAKYDKQMAKHACLPEEGKALLPRLADGVTLWGLHMPHMSNDDWTSQLETGEAALLKMFFEQAHGLGRRVLERAE